jgi:TolB-like protein/DNA-binding winged helix-turn-helix (wHTH) protein
MSELPAFGPPPQAAAELRPRGLRFSVFELDLLTLELRRSGRLVRLQQQPAKVLALLARRRGELVTRDEIRCEVWAADTFVDFEQGLNFCVRQIRAALGDNAEAPRFVETLPRRGYRFIAPVEALGEPEDVPRGVAAAPPRRPARWVPGAALALLAASGVALWLTRPTGRTPAAERAARSVLVVLPFENLSGEAADAYLADGLTEETITQLARAAPERLGVIARTTSMRLRGARRSVHEIGRELGADYVLEGSVRRSGERLRVTAQLVRVEDELHLWAQSYDRGLRDALELQDDLAFRVTGSLLDALLAGAPVARARRGTTSGEAYDAYLKGRYQLAKGGAEAIRRAIALLQEATSLDPGFPEAHAALAEAWIALGDGLFVRPREAYPKARAAAEAALALDADLAEAWSCLGVVKTYYEWDLEAGPPALDRAAALAPGSARAHHHRAEYLSATGRHDEAIAATRRAQALDPLSRVVNEDVGWYYYFARRFPEAAAQFRRTAELEPSLPGLPLFASHAFASAGDWPAALAEARRVLVVSGEDPAAAERSLQRGGRAAYHAFLRRVVAWRRRQASAVLPYSFAILAELGEREAALRDLERARDERWRYLLVEVGGDPRLDPLRAEPRFEAVERQLGLGRLKPS